MQDLVDATGVNRASLYATYGDKRELFLASLRKYGGEVRGRMLADPAQADTAAQAIAGLFDKFISQSREPQGNWGCFMVTSALEMAENASELAELVKAAEDAIENGSASGRENGGQD